MKRQWLLQAFCAGFAVFVFGAFPPKVQAKVVNGDVAYIHGFVLSKVYGFSPITNSTRQLLPGSIGEFFSDEITDDETANYRKLAWSPDGRWIAYQNSDFSLDECEISATSATPLETRCLVPSKLLTPRKRQRSETFTFGWSTDGHWLAIAYSLRTSARNAKTVLAIVNTQGTPTVNKLVALNNISIGQLEWSPGGRSIVFSAHKKIFSRMPKNSRAFSPGVYLLDVASHKVTRFPGTNRSDYAPTWSPNGSRLAVVGEIPGKDTFDQVITIDTATTARTQITNDRLMKQDLEWSPDGTSLLFSSFDVEGEEDGFGPDDPPLSRRIYIVQPDGNGLRTLLSSDQDSQPAWQPLIVPDDPPPPPPAE